MKTLEKLLRNVEHYTHAINDRAYILRELVRAGNQGHRIPRGFYHSALKRPHSVEDWIMLMRLFPAATPMHLIDVGANNGGWSSQFLNLFPNSTAVCFEPVPRTFAQLERRFAGDGRVQVHHLGISDTQSEAKMFLDPADLEGGGATLHKYDEFVSNYNSRSEEVTVSLRRLDQFLDSEGTNGRTTILKIDTQGHEIAVLASAADRLSLCDAVYVEMNLGTYSDTRGKLHEVFSMLGNNDLHLCLIQKVTERSFAPHPVELDALFVKQSLMSNLKPVFGY